MRTILAASIVAAFAALWGMSRMEGPVQTGVLFRTITVGGREFRYAVYVPRDYDPSRAWPALVFLNGSGECGTDGQKQLAVGLLPAVLAHSERWPFVIVFPQKPETSSKWEDYNDTVTATLDGAEREWRIDRAREYLTGLSQGGHGTWAIAALHADRFAAIAPVCGYGDARKLAPKLASVPAWAFHGADDDVVPVNDTKAMVAAIQRAGGSARMTIYPGVRHNSWENAYAEDELPKWLLSNSRQGR